MQVARNLIFDPRLLPGGGATEMAVAAALNTAAATVEGVEQGPFRSVASAMEVIPRTLAQNCGADTVRAMTALRVCACAPFPCFFLFWPCRPGPPVATVDSLRCSSAVRFGHAWRGRVAG